MLCKAPKSTEKPADVSLSELWELVMDREVWCAAIHGVTKSRTCQVLAAACGI